MDHPVLISERGTLCQSISRTCERLLMVSKGLHEVGQSCRYRGYRRRVSADNGDHLVTVHLQIRVEANHDVVSEHANGVL